MERSDRIPFATGVAPLLAGISGGAASTVLLYPLDLVKVRLQVNEDPVTLRRKKQPMAGMTGGERATTYLRPRPSPVAGRNAVGSIDGKGGQLGDAIEHSRHRRRTIMCTVRGVIRHEGFLGLYQGLSPALIGSAASWGGYFFLYEGIKKELLEKKKKLVRTNGGFAKALCSDDVGNESYDASVVMHADEEIGFESSAVELGALENFSAACLAGAAMVLLTNPLWLIKTRMQLQMKKVAVGHKEIKRPYNGLVDAAMTIVREEGPLALYKGAIPAMMLVSHGGVQFVSYEFLKSRFGTFTKSVRERATTGNRNNVMERL